MISSGCANVAEERRTTRRRESTRDMGGSVCPPVPRLSPSRSGAVGYTQPPPHRASMHLNLLNRKIHYWATAFVAIPVLVIICSGVLLQMKKHWQWVQPEEKRGMGTAPSVDLEAILASVQAVPGLGVKSWDDVN